MSKVKHDNFIVQDGDIEAQVIKVDLQERLEMMKQQKKSSRKRNVSSNKIGIALKGDSELQAFEDYDKEERNGQPQNREEIELQKELDVMSELEKDSEIALSDVKFISNNSVNRRILELEKKEVRNFKLLFKGKKKRPSCGFLQWDSSEC